MLYLPWISRLLFALLTVLAVSSPAFAQWGNSRSTYGNSGSPKSGSTYDWQSGNSYN